MIVTALAALSLAGAYQIPLTPAFEVVSEKVGGFGAVAYDPKFARMLICHTGARTLMSVDASKGFFYMVRSEPEIGAADYLQVDTPLNRVFAVGAKKLLAIDEATLQTVGQVELGGPAGNIAIDTKRQEVYVAHHDGAEDWIFDANTLKPLGSVDLGGKPGEIQYDPATDKLYQAIHSDGLVQVIDPTSRKVEANWAAPARQINAFAIDHSRGLLFTADNGKVVEFDRSGRVNATLDTGLEGGFRLAYDEGNQRLYVCGHGRIGGVDTTGEALRSVGDVEYGASDARGIAVDPVSHEVWVSVGNPYQKQKVLVFNFNK